MNLSRSRVGRALSALNDSEVAAETLGVRTFRLRLGVFVLSGGLAGLGGVFYAYHVSLVSPSVAEFHLSIEFLLMAVIGGLGSVWGALAGAFAVEWLGDGLRDLIPVLIPGATGEVQLVGFGIALVVVIVALPGGIHQAVMGIARWVGRMLRRRSPEAAVASDTTLDSSTEADPAGAAAPLPSVSVLLPRDEVILEVSGLGKHYGGVVAVEDLSFTVGAGQIVGLIGPNGAGKTSCFNMISGVLTPSTGEVRFLGHRISGRRPSVAAALGLTRTFQNLQVFSSTDVLGNVYMGRYLRGRGGFLRGLFGLQSAEQRTQRERAGQILSTLGLEDAASTPAADLPFGKQRIMEVARALASEPALLLLDEPMAGLTGQERDRLAGLLRGLRDAGLTTVIVEHDVAQVLSIADDVLVLDDGVLIARGDPDQIRADPLVIAAYLGVDDDAAASAPRAAAKSKKPPQSKGAR
jgi:branched-chain amino acid transport system permease protein